MPYKEIIAKAKKDLEYYYQSPLPTWEDKKPEKRRSWLTEMKVNAKFYGGEFIEPKRPNEIASVMRDALTRDGELSSAEIEEVVYNLLDIGKHTRMTKDVKDAIDKDIKLDEKAKALLDIMTVKKEIKGSSQKVKTFTYIDFKYF